MEKENILNRNTKSPYIPLKISNIDFNEVEPIVPNKTNLFSELDIETIIYRYISGGIALREARNVPVKNLFLSKEALTKDDYLTLSLLKKSSEFKKTVECIEGSITLDKLNEINAKILMKSTSKVRENQNWIGGGGIKSALFIPPRPEKLYEYLNDLISFASRDDLSSSLKAIVFHNQLISLHPFNDGNGRTARAFLESMTSSNKRSIPLSAYRLASNQDYGSSLEESRISIGALANEKYWLRAKDWVNNLQNSLEKHLSESKKIISSHFILSNNKFDINRLVRTFIKKPLICLDNFPDYLHIGVNDFDAVLKTISHSKQFKLWRCNNKVVIECVTSMEIYEVFETELFKDNHEH
ncbi:Fic family protein [Gallaecimonas pentaromativorans]|uniref:Fic family protein n=1 Tax=Gallaecimonas pentaromativorans TaxID=584787 RepID=UPI003A8EC9CD